MLWGLNRAERLPCLTWCNSVVRRCMYTVTGGAPRGWLTGGTEWPFRCLGAQQIVTLWCSSPSPLIVVPLMFLSMLCETCACAQKKAKNQRKDISQCNPCDITSMSETDHWSAVVFFSIWPWKASQKWESMLASTSVHVLDCLYAFRFVLVCLCLCACVHVASMRVGCVVHI